MTKNDLVEKRERGNQPLTEVEIKSIFHQIEPYLKIGFSLNKASIEAGVPKSTANKLYDNHEWFETQVDKAKHQVALLTSTSFYRLLRIIQDKQVRLDLLSEQLISGEINQSEYDEQSKRYALTREDIELLKWNAIHSKATREEYGERSEITGQDGKSLGFPPDYGSVTTALLAFEKVREKIHEQPKSNL